MPPVARSCDAIFFDVMDTLVVDPFWESVPKVFGMPLEEYYKLKDPEAYLEFERGHLTEAQYSERIFLDRRGVDLEKLKTFYREHYRLIDGIEDLLNELRANGVPMYALSNYSSFYRLIEDKLHLSQWLDWGLVSCITGLRKPDPQAYLHGLNLAGTQPHRTLFVDDRTKNVSGAKSCGLRGHEFTDVSTLREELERLGLL